MLDVKHLRLVRAVAEQGTVTRAAASLFLTQSALSHQLLTLEKRVGAPLFLREGKRMTPTAAGRRLLASAERILADLASLEDELRRVASGRDVRIRLSTECYTTYAWLPRAMEEFTREHPSVEIQIAADAAPVAIQALLDGRLDVAIAFNAAMDPRLESVPLFEDELVALMRPDHRLASRPYLVPPDFAAENLLVYSVLELSTFYLTVLEPACIRPRRVSTAHLTEAMVEMARAGMGIPVLARWAVADQIGRGLVAVPITETGVRRHWRGVFRKGDPAERQIRAFLASILARPALEGRIEPAA